LFKSHKTAKLIRSNKKKSKSVYPIITHELTELHNIFIWKLSRTMEAVLAWLNTSGLTFKEKVSFLGKAGFPSWFQLNITNYDKKDVLVWFDVSRAISTRFS